MLTQIVGRYASEGLVNILSTFAHVAAQGYVGPLQRRIWCGHDGLCYVGAHESQTEGRPLYGTSPGKDQREAGMGETSVVANSSEHS